jgi:hypothetical protein
MTDDPDLAGLERLARAYRHNAVELFDDEGPARTEASRLAKSNAMALLAIEARLELLTWVLMGKL